MRARALLLVAAALVLGLALPAAAQPPGRYPVMVRPSTLAQYHFKIDNSTTPNRTEIGCEVDQLGGTFVNGLRIVGAVAGSGATISGVGCTNGGDANPGVTIGATGQTLTLLGTVVAANLSFTTLTATGTSNQIVLGTSPNTTTISAPAPSGAITLTLPITTDTLVGRATTDTLTNKTVSGPSFSATQYIATLGSFGQTPLTLRGDVFIGQNVDTTSLGPGFPGITLRVKRGTSPGTCKLVAVGGSSTLEQLVVDNVGSGCM